MWIQDSIKFTTNESTLLYHHRKFHPGLILNNLDISKCFNAIFVQQPSVLEFGFYKDLRCHRLKVLLIPKMFSPINSHNFFTSYSCEETSIYQWDQMLAVVALTLELPRF